MEISRKQEMVDFKASILSTYFCRITRLSQLIKTVSLQPPPSLLAFLNSVVIAAEHEVDLLPKRFSNCCFFTLEDVLHRSIERLLDAKSSNVLSLGYTIIREGYKRFCISGSNRVQVKAPNTIVTFLKTKTWNEIHVLLGDDILMHILQKTSLFLAIENGCYIQLCGLPLNERYPSTCSKLSRCKMITSKYDKGTDATVSFFINLYDSSFL